MRQKEFTKKQVKKEIKKLLFIFNNNELQGTKFRLTDILGDYQNNSMKRHIKEVLFYNLHDTSFHGTTWYFKYPTKSAKKLAKKVMKTKYVTYNF